MPPIDQLLDIMAKLRDPKTGCPWDVAQDFASIIPHTLEEAYEVADAVEKGDMKSLREELGDLLLQVVFHAQMAKEKNIFTFDDVVDAINAKLISRHPHVFADGEKVNTAEAQTEAWEKHKDAEKQQSSGGIDDPLAGVPLNMPGLSRALKLQKRAARTGFDWANLEAVFEKLDEETEELMQVLARDPRPEAVLEEVGDMIFTCVNLARKLKVDPEEAVRFCNAKFEKRFGYMRMELGSQERNMGDASLQELNDLWDQAKIAEAAEIKKKKSL